jgi:hypothetical protein
MLILATCRFLAGAAGPWCVSLVLVTLLAMQAGRTAADTYITLWSAGSQGMLPHDSFATTAASMPQNVSNQSHPQQPESQATDLLGPAWTASVLQPVALSGSLLSSSDRDNDHSVDTFLRWLLLLTAATVVATVLRAFLFAYTGLKSARNIHKHLLQACAPMLHVMLGMAKFETEPILPETANITFV